MRPHGPELEDTMDATSELYPTIPVLDLARAVAFYRDRLGLSVLNQDMPGIALLANGKGNTLLLFARHPATADHALAAFVVDDIEAEVDALVAAGVTFEHYELGPGTVADARGILAMGPAKAAWFRDSEGNLLGLNNRL